MNEANPLNITLEQHTNDLETATDLNKETIRRLLETAFADSDRALMAYDHHMKRGGPEEVIRLLQKEDGIRTRLTSFGFLAGGLFAHGRRARARQALSELPDAIRRGQTLTDQLNDARRAHRARLEREDLERIRALRVERAEERDRDQTREVTLKRTTPRSRSRKR